MDLLLNSGEKLVVEDVEKAELFHAFFLFSPIKSDLWDQTLKCESNKFRIHSCP